MSGETRLQYLLDRYDTLTVEERKVVAAQLADAAKRIAVSAGEAAAAFKRVALAARQLGTATHLLGRNGTDQGRGEA